MPNIDSHNCCGNSRSQGLLVNTVMLNSDISGKYGWDTRDICENAEECILHFLRGYFLGVFVVVSGSKHGAKEMTNLWYGMRHN